MSKSVFTEYVETLAKWSERIDNLDINWNDFVEFQRLEMRIINAYQNKYFKYTQYRPLINIFYALMDDFRSALKLI